MPCAIDSFMNGAGGSFLAFDSVTLLEFHFFWLDPFERFTGKMHCLRSSPVNAGRLLPEGGAQNRLQGSFRHA